MILADVNVLIYAFRRESVNHVAYRDWLEQAVNSESNFAVADVILSAVIRIVTNPKTYAKPTDLDNALRFARYLRERPNATSVNPAARHWQIFTELCSTLGARGNLIPDCYLAAIAIEHRCEWISADQHFARFPGLRWRPPFR